MKEPAVAHRGLKYNFLPNVGGRIVIPVSRVALPIRSWRIALVVSIVLLAGCAYFNTFYNAKTYYEAGVKALDTRIAASSDNIPKPASDAFGKAIEKSLKVIDKYPESKYIDDAFFIIGRSHFHRREYGMAERYLRQLLQEYPWSPFNDQALIWLAKVHVQLGLYEAVEEDIAPILAQPSPPRELLTEIYLLRGDIALLQGDVSAAMNAFQEGAKLAIDTAQRAAIYHQLYTLAMDEDDYAAALGFLDRYARATPKESERVNARLTRVQLRQKMNDFEGAYKEIRNMVVLTEFASIIPGLQLELGKIESLKGNRPAALERFIEVLEEFGNLPEASEAAFRAGEIYLTELHETETAKEYLQRVKNNSVYYLPAQAKLKQIATFSEMNKRIHSLRAQLSPDTDKEIDTTEAAVDTTRIRRELAHALYRLGEIQLFEMEAPDTALEVMAEIVSNFYDTDVAAQAAYVLYVHTQDNPEQAAFWRALMLEQYPDSPYGRLLSDKSATMGDPRLDSLMVLVDVKVSRNPRQALNIFREIRSQFDTEQSCFAIAYIYDEYLNQLDNAIIAYDEYLALYPSGTYSKDAGKRLEFLRQIKASLSVTPTTADAVPRSSIPDSTGAMNRQTPRELPDTLNAPR